LADFFFEEGTRMAPSITGKVAGGVVLASTSVTVAVATGVVSLSSPPSAQTALPTATLTQVTEQTAIPTEKPTATERPTDKPIATEAPTSTAVEATGVPVILGIEQIENRSGTSPVLYLKVSFADADGDASLLDWELVSSTIHVVVTDDPISNPSDEQKNGATATGTWQCGSSNYSAVLKVTVVDKKGNRSNAVEHSFDCHPIVVAGGQVPLYGLTIGDEYQLPETATEALARIFSLDRTLSCAQLFFTGVVAGERVLLEVDTDPCPQNGCWVIRSEVQASCSDLALP
jgi:hypothetical protein